MKWNPIAMGFSIWNGFGVFQNKGYPCNGILFSNIKKQNTNICYHTMNLKSIMLSEKKPFTKHDILDDSIYKKYPE